MEAVGLEKTSEESRMWKELMRVFVGSSEVELNGFELNFRKP